MNCPKCNSTKVTVQAVAEQKKRGILGVCLWLILGFFTCGVALLFPLFIKKGSKTKQYAICQECGYRREVK